MLTFVQYFILIKEWIKSAQETVPEHLEDIIEKNLICLNSLNNPSKKLPLFNGSTDRSLNNFFNYLDKLNPINVLTKLDEITVNSYDFSMYHDLNCKLGLLSGTNNIIDSIAFANSLILAQYMKEN